MAASPSSRLALRVLLVAVAAASLAPLARVAAGWAEYAEVVGKPLSRTPPRGYSGVRWDDTPTGVVAADVFPGSPADVAGVRTGDRLAAVDAEIVGSAGDAEARTERAAGTVQGLRLDRGGTAVLADVSVARYPTFLYPRSRLLWTGAAWAFAVVAFLHLLALLTVLPLARRGGRALRVAVLVGTALVWVGGNLLRIAWVSLEGAPGTGGGVSAALFDGLTLVALAGWTVFPALLLRQSVLTSRAVRQAVDGLLWIVFVPPAMYGALLGVAIVRGHAGPLPPDALVAPVLFYVCLYVAAATALVLWRARGDRVSAEPDDLPPPTWYRMASAAALVVVVAGAAFAWRAGPATEADVAAGWFVTALQLVSLLPVVLVSLATLRYGRFDTVLMRGTAYVTALGVVFAVVAGGAALLRAVGGFGPTALGAARRRGARRSPSARHRHCGDASRGRSSPTATAPGGASTPSASASARSSTPRRSLPPRRRPSATRFEPRSAVVFLRAGLGGPDERWTQATFRPEPPHFTASELDRVWDRVREGGLVWAAMDELREAELPRADADRLRRFGVALAVPLTSSPEHGTAAGLIAVGPTTRRRGVYSTDDVERLRLLGAQLALAVERLALIERETTLVRQTAEAELVALRAQINPHFLFNALNTVAALIAERPDEAEATVESLAGLFRDVLTASGRPEVPLRDELRLVQRYLTVEKARFGDELDVTVEATPEALERLLPAFAVQTLVENAVKHGVERRRGGGAVRVAARVDAAGALVVAVSDTGVGIPALFGARGRRDFHGVGLGNVAARLRGLYGSSDGLRISSTPKGTTATLTLPDLHAASPVNTTGSDAEPDD